MIKLHVGRPNTPEIEKVDYDECEDFREITNAILAAYEGHVFLVAYEDEYNDAVFVEHKIITIENYIYLEVICGMDDYVDECDIDDVSVWIYVLDSYEEAYKMALDMKEPSGLCYKKDKPTHIKIDLSAN